MMNAAPVPAPRDDLDAFAGELEELGRRVRASLGPDDLAYMRRVVQVSRASGLIGRLLIAGSATPIGFGLGVSLLSLHKVLEVGEIGHTVLHGTYDKLDATGALASRTFWWEFPIDEDAWRHGHNIRHHRYTNIVGRDADTAFGFLRLTDEAPHRLLSYLQLPATLFGALPSFGLLGQLHYTGVFDLLLGNGLTSRFDFIPDRRPRTIAKTLWHAAKKPLLYWAKNYGLYPALAGPFGVKLIAGTWLAERVRDIWAGITILSSHTGPHVASFPVGTRAGSKGEYYKMQVEAANNFEMPHAISILCGGLDHQIEHHLFPELPPNRTRAIARDVRDICARYGVRYQSSGLATTVLNTARSIARLSLP